MAETKSKKASNAQSDEKPTAIIAYKGFDKDLRCRGFQFEVGKTYTVDGEIVACSNGFHACTNPLDVWNYYPIINDDGELNRFAVVTQGGALSRNNDADSKVASASITIDIELSLPAFIKHTIDFVVDLTKSDASSGDYATNASSGDNAKNASSGNYGRNSASGANSVIMSAGVGTLNKGPVGTWIGAAEYDDSGNCIGIVRGCVGQDGIEPDTWYIARGGKLAKVEG